MLRGVRASRPRRRGVSPRRNSHELLHRRGRAQILRLVGDPIGRVGQLRASLADRAQGDEVPALVLIARVPVLEVRAVGPDGLSLLDDEDPLAVVPGEIVRPLVGVDESRAVLIDE